MSNSNYKQTTSGVRAILYVAGILVLSVGISLFFLSDKTAVYFSWPINPPLTAAFLGAGYLASFLLEYLSARERVWAKARAAVPGVWVFTALTLIVTLIHIDKFSFAAPALITRIGTWVWLAIYVSVPIAMGWLWFLQASRPGGDPPQNAPLPSSLRITLILQGIIMLVVGVILILFPNTGISIWPWKLSALTARAIGAWGVGIGVIALHAFWENDWSRLRAMMTSYAVYGLLQVINILRFANEFSWGHISTTVYAFFVGSILLVGAYGMMRTRKAE